MTVMAPRRTTQVARVGRSRKQAAVAVALPLIRVEMVGPVGMEEDLMAAAKKVYAKTGQRIKVAIEPVEPEIVAAPGVEVTRPARQTQQAQQGGMQQVQQQQAYRRPARVPQVQAQVPQQGNGGNQGRNAVVYQVLDRRAAQTINTGTTRGTVASFILMRGPHSAKDIMLGTGLRQKPVESALHALRTEGIIQSVAVQ